MFPGAGVASVAIVLGVIQEHRAIIDWHENLDVQREMRRDIKRLLRDTGRYSEDELDEVVRQVVEVARRQLG